jgi:prepilin-type N-terminal cleavage/methylation domain-containing protein
MTQDCSRRHRQGGFTLVEILVVLAIIAVLGTLAYTYVIPLYARARAAYEQDDIERQLLKLPQRVRQSGHGGILTSWSGDDLQNGTLIAVEGAAKAGNALEQWQVLRLALPQGWRLQVGHPIFYHFSGTCEGGEVDVVLGADTLRYVLTAPLCRPIRADVQAAG